MIFGFSISSTPGTYWDGGESVVTNVLLNWHGSVTRHDGRNSYAAGTGFENGSAKCEFWRLTVVEETNNSGEKYHDILYEGFTNKDRTAATRTIYGLASRMYHSGTITNGQSLMKNNSKFYFRYGGHQSGTGLLSNFVSNIAVPIYKPKPPSDANKLVDLNFDKPKDLNELPNTVF